MGRLEIPIETSGRGRLALLPSGDRLRQRAIAFVVTKHPVSVRSPAATHAIAANVDAAFLRSLGSVIWLSTVVLLLRG